CWRGSPPGKTRSVQIHARRARNACGVCRSCFYLLIGEGREFWAEIPPGEPKEARWRLRTRDYNSLRRIRKKNLSTRPRPQRYGLRARGYASSTSDTASSHVNMTHEHADTASVHADTTPDHTDTCTAHMTRHWNILT